MSLIKEFIKRCGTKTLKIGVIGDTILDEYFYASSERLSPEFPVPILSFSSEAPDYVVPGGAANVCYQFSRLQCVESYLTSLLNNWAHEILRIDHAINTSQCFFGDGKIQIPIKRRYYNGDHPFCRIDIERENFSLNWEELRRFQECVARPMDFIDYDIMILSDYGKGMFEGQNALDSWKAKQRWNSLGIPTIVDPRNEPIAGWHNYSVLKPNAKEASLLSHGIKDWKSQCVYFKGQAKCRSIVITNGGNGVRGWCDDTRDYFEFLNDRKSPARSVVGAGDCFSAFLALAMAHGFSVKDSAEIAFKAGAVYVQNVRNRPISLYDLMKYEDPIAAKYMQPFLSGLPPAPQGRLVMANGIFDLLHIGHINTLRFAKSKGDYLIVALNDDESTRCLKGDSRPVQSLADRMAIVAALDCVDFVVSFSEETPYECIQRIKPNVLVKGGEYSGRSVLGCDLVEKVYFSDMIEGVSTTETIRKLNAATI